MPGQVHPHPSTPLREHPHHQVIQDTIQAAVAFSQFFQDSPRTHEFAQPLLRKETDVTFHPAINHTPKDGKINSSLKQETNFRHRLPHPAWDHSGFQRQQEHECNSNLTWEPAHESSRMRWLLDNDLSQKA